MSGIYKITNLINGKIYIGQSRNLRRRQNEYSRYSEKKGHGLMKRAILKYGWGNFRFEVIEECPADLLNEREEFHINEFKSYEKGIGYNMVYGAESHHNHVYSTELREKRSEQYTGEGNPFHGKSHSQASRRSMSESRKLSVGDKASFYGKSHSAESKAKISEKKRGKLMGEENHFHGKTHSDEAKKAISDSKRGKPNLLKRIPIVQIELETGEVIKTFDSATSAALELKGSAKYSSVLSSVLTGKRKSAWGFGWKFL
jgi:group I intron endonuclease